MNCRSEAHPKSPDDEWAHEAVVVYMQDRSFNSFASNMIKLSVNIS